MKVNYEITLDYEITQHLLTLALNDADEFLNATLSAIANGNPYKTATLYASRACRSQEAVTAIRKHLAARPA